MYKFYLLIELFFKIILNNKITIGRKLKFLILNTPTLLSNNIFNRFYKKSYLFDGRKFIYFGQHKNLLFDHLLSHLRSYSQFYGDASLILDVGASFGTFSLIAHFFNDQSTIYAFEPSSESFKVLKENCVNIKNINLINCAVGNTSNKKQFNFNPLNPEESKIVESEDDSCLVDQIILDNFIKDKQICNISLLKIDVEGYELNVLQGATNTLDLCDIIIIEVNCNLENLVQVFRLLYNRNFTLINIGKIYYKNRKLDSIDFIFKRKKLYVS